MCTSMCVLSFSVYKRAHHEMRKYLAHRSKPFPNNINKNVHFPFLFREEIFKIAAAKTNKKKTTWERNERTKTWIICKIFRMVGCSMRPCMPDVYASMCENVWRFHFWFFFVLFNLDYLEQFKQKALQHLHFVVNTRRQIYIYIYIHLRISIRFKRCAKSVKELDYSSKKIKKRKRKYFLLYLRVIHISVFPFEWSIVHM